MTNELTLLALEGLPLVSPNDDVADLIIEALNSNQQCLKHEDVLVIAQKIISKAENRYVYLDDVVPSEKAIAFGVQCDKDPRQVELVLRESNEVLRCKPGVIVVEHRNGYVHANAGIDKSNIESDDASPRVLLLPEDADASAQSIREKLLEKLNVNVSIIINDSAGRAWRNGTVGFALGTAGFEPIDNRIGDVDLFGRQLQVTETAVADELAAAGSFLMGQADEGLPVVLVRGANLNSSTADSKGLIREKDKDMFR